MTRFAIIVALVGGCIATLCIGSTIFAQDREARSGEQVYNDKCVYCHDGRGWGTRVLARRVPEGQAELTRRESLPEGYTATVVRRGIGSMPPFTPTEISDEEIAAVARWLAGSE